MQHLGRRSVTSVLLGALLLLPVLAGPAAARGPSAEHERVVAYWTKDRIAAARPVAMTRVTGSPLAKPVAPAPSAAPGDTTGSLWPDGQGLVYRAVGRVLFTMGNSDYVCSGVAANDSRADVAVVLTAGHCVYDQKKRKFATNWIFIPEFDRAPTLRNCGTTVHGCWTAQRLIVHDGYAGQRNFNNTAVQHDWAFAVVGGGGKAGTAQLDATVGSFPIAFSSYPNGTSVAALGYPAAGKYSPGNELAYCSGPVGSDPSVSNLTYRLPCDMTGGSSGGPWFTNFDADGNSGTLSSVNSYGYSGVVAMHGPKFNSKTQATWNAAVGTGTGNVVVR